MLVVDRLRSVLVPAGYPGLGQEVRETARSAAEVREQVDEALRPTALDPLRREQFLALALCWHDRWDASHDVCQTREGDPDMDLVHAVLHRREGDGDNARYWLARVGHHPAWSHLAPVAAAEGMAGLTNAGGRWQPDIFLARCLAAEPAEVPALIRLQAAELLALVDHLATHPTAGGKRVAKPAPAGR